MTLLAVRTLVRLLNTIEPTQDLKDATGVAYDSRSVRRGDIFFALPGASGHGMVYADAALERGAAFIVSDRPHRQGLLVDDARAALLALGRAARDRLSVPVVAVTGSVGKTSTKAMLAAAMRARSTAGNLNTHYAIAQTLIDAAMADAPAPDGATALVIELGIDRIGEMAELLELTRPDHALLTTISPSHLSALGDLAGVAREKTLLLDRTNGVTVASAQAAAYLNPETLARTVVVAVGDGVTPEPYPGALGSVRGATAAHGTATRLTWRSDDDGGTVDLPWPGSGMAQNALSALTLATLTGTPVQEAAAGLVSAQLEPGRLGFSHLPGITLLDDSYNSNPTSLREAITVLRASPPPHVAFLGDMRELGALERDAHLQAGELTTRLDLTVAVGPASAALLETNPQAVHEPDARAALRHLGAVPVGATVLVKGSRSMGMELLATELKRLAALGAWQPDDDAPKEGAAC